MNKHKPSYFIWQKWYAKTQKVHEKLYARRNDVDLMPHSYQPPFYQLSCSWCVRFEYRGRSWLESVCVCVIGVGDMQTMCWESVFKHFCSNKRFWCGVSVTCNYSHTKSLFETKASLDYDTSQTEWKYNWTQPEQRIPMNWLFCTFVGGLICVGYHAFEGREKKSHDDKMIIFEYSS